jgi:RNA polymerase sigma factor (sigma-70 family)
MTGPPDDPRDDETLLVATSRGDAAAFAALYRRHLDGVLAFFYRRTRCPHTAADLAAETFAEVLAGARRFDPGRGEAVAWLYGAANNLFRRWARNGRVARRRRERLGIVTPALTHEDVEHIEQLVDSAALRAGLADALEALSPSLRNAVLLRVGEDLPYAEVARRLGCSVDAARARVSRGMAKLEQHLAVTS